ncbi:MAG TPA: glycosyltransferase family 4 protein [Ktedonobacteraceae bacterium]|nr:glycosyltransferase family 4 protein [Ktedonobacteraceae bacterium]
MEKVTYPDNSLEAAPTAMTPVEVCMLLLNPARNDYRVMRDATALVEAGFIVTIVDVEGERTRPVEEVIDGVHLQHIFMPSWFISERFKPWFLVKLALLTLLGTVRLLRIPADIYHAHVERALLACYIAARLRRKPLIFDSPDLPFEDPSYTRWRSLTAIATRLFTYMLPRCEGVITSSPPNAEVLQKRYHTPEVTLIRNVPVYRAVSKSDRLRQHLDLSPGTCIALYQGLLLPSRRLDILVRAAKFLEPNIVIVIMGKDFKGIKSQLEALIASEGVADRVKIIPPVPAYEEVPEWTASADIGLILYNPGYSLNVKLLLPNKLFEYMMAGLPVLASQLDAIAEVIRTNDIGQILTSVDPAEVAAAINKMLADPVALSRMSRNGLVAAEQEFRWEKESPKLVRLYHDILERR